MLIYMYPWWNSRIKFYCFFVAFILVWMLYLVTNSNKAGHTKPNLEGLWWDNKGQSWSWIGFAWCCFLCQHTRNCHQRRHSLCLFNCSSCSFTQIQLRTDLISRILMCCYLILCRLVVRIMLFLQEESEESYNDDAMIDIPKSTDDINRTLELFSIKGFNERETVNLFGTWFKRFLNPILH